MDEFVDNDALPEAPAAGVSLAEAAKPPERSQAASTDATVVHQYLRGDSLADFIGGALAHRLDTVAEDALATPPPVFEFDWVRAVGIEETLFPVMK